MAEDRVNRVAITDVDMPFTSMVRFMVKWAIAAIPALFLLLLLAAVFWGVLLGVITSIGSSWSRKATTETTPASSTQRSEAESRTGEPRSSGSDPTRSAYLSKVLVRNVHVSKTYLGEGVFGEIKNSGDRVLKEVEITIFCLDTEGKPVFETKYHPVLVSGFGIGDAAEPLKPGYSRQFGVKLDSAPSDWSKKVDVKVTSVEFQ